MPKEALSQPHEGVWLDVEGEMLELAVHQRQGLVGGHVVLRLPAGHTHTSHAHGQLLLLVLEDPMRVLEGAGTVQGRTLGKRRCREAAIMAKEHGL